jgi:TetR/AcrR family transcriptional repressor of mexJK operon
MSLRAGTMNHAHVTLGPTVTTPPPAKTVPDITDDEDRGSPLTRTGRGGRPSRTDALLLGERILAVATELFLTEGYGSTTIEAVAVRAGISKRTFYHRFDGKQALFAAVVHRIIAQIRPPPDVPLLEGATLDDVLRRLARLILRAALSPDALALHRLITAESARFPELVRAVNAEGGEREATGLIADLLASKIRDPAFTAEARLFAAQQFLHMVVTLPQRRAMGLGAAMTATELDAWADSVVRLFLNGCRAWAPADA